MRAQGHTAGAACTHPHGSSVTATTGTHAHTHTVLGKVTEHRRVHSPTVPAQVHLGTPLSNWLVRALPEQTGLPTREVSLPIPGLHLWSLGGGSQYKRWAMCCPLLHPQRPAGVGRALGACSLMPDLPSFVQPISGESFLQSVRVAVKGLSQTSLFPVKPK